METGIKDLIGKTLSKITNNDYELIFECTDGTDYRMYHDQDCCENVRIDDIEGDLKDLIGYPLLQAEEISNDAPPPEYADSYTWTFYKFATVKGYVTIKWLGESNGYYSESVSFVQTN